MPWWDLRSLSCFGIFRVEGFWALAVFNVVAVALAVAMSDLFNKINRLMEFISSIEFNMQDVSSKRSKISVVTSDWFPPSDFPLIEHKNEEERMREVQLGSHTVRSHGVTVAKMHMHDWWILMLLGLIWIILNKIHPFYRFVGKDMMTDLKYPLKSNTVPVWAVPIYSLLLPIAIFVVVYFRRRDVYDLHHAILGLLYSVFITAVITDAIKDAVGRPRPDFFWRCFPDGNDVYDTMGNVVCHGKKNVIKEGHKSFPSGHTALSFAGLGFLSLYLSGKIKVFDQRGHVAKLCIVFLPLLVASLVGISRVDDYWHHWQDVFAGGLLGLTVATFCYLQFFAPPHHPEGWGPYAYFKVLEESRASTQAAIAVNSRSAQAVQPQVDDKQDERSIHGCMGISIAPNSGSALEDIESGRR